MRVVVFGAGGGIGGSICEALQESPDAEVVACVRNWASSVRLARRGMDLVQCDIADALQVSALIKGADAVVNAAMLPPSMEAALVGGLFDACRTGGVGRFVQLSSAVVYGDRTGEIDEETPVAPNSEYARGKVLMEQILCERAERSDVRVSILRPSIVYGPFSDAWTVRYAQRIAVGHWRSLGRIGAGLCNAIYTYDLARCAIAAATGAVKSDGPLVVNVNGAETVSWNDYIERFGDALSITERSVPDMMAFNASVYTGEILRAGGAWFKKRWGPLFSALSQSTGVARGAIDSAKSVGKLFPSADECRLLRREVRYSARKAVMALGFEPRVTLSDGLEISARWCKAHGIIG